MRTTVADFLLSSHTCLLLVSPDVCRLEDAADGLLSVDELLSADELLSVYDWPRLPVGRELGAALLSELPQRRPRAADRWTKARLGAMAPGPVLCTETDLLFEPTLKLDPLRLVRDASRVTRLVVAWPGSYADGVLAYAVPEHSHYRTWRNPGVSIAVLE